MLLGANAEVTPMMLTAATIAPNISPSLGEQSRNLRIRTVPFLAPSRIIVVLRQASCLSLPCNFEPLDIRRKKKEQGVLLTPTLLTYMCTQVLWCRALFARPRASGVTMTPDIRLTNLLPEFTRKYLAYY